MSSYCETELGLPYECDMPLPRSAFNQSGPICSTVAQYLYDPANCDAGYWCGCDTQNQTMCYPGSDHWIGQFTTKYTNGSELIIGELADECPPTYYCPGKSNVDVCVDLCPPKFYCPSAAEAIPCEDGYCPVASIAPRKCQGLEGCNEDDLRRFTVGGASGVMLVIIVAAFVYLFAGRHMVVRKARINREKKMAAARDASDSVNTTKEGEDNGAEEKEVEVDVDSEIPEESTKRRGLRQRIKDRQESRGKGRRRSTLTAPEMTVDIAFERLRLTIPGVGTIMRGVSGKIDHGNLTAIMGPSGAGKTTFLTLMSGKVDRTGGMITVNAEEAQLSEFRNVIGFVPQEDIMMRDLTVEENVTHSALMRLPTNWTREKKMARVDEVLESLEIDHIRDSVVGDENRRGISGGQRKRVNIAMEMVVKPSLCCLDEPTSGLDSTTSFTVMNSLRDMARAGANVITVLHQPKYEVFELFDNVLLLGKGGMTVYYGPTSGLEAYFEKRGFPCPPRANPADYYMDVLSGIIPHADNDDWKREDLFEEWMTAEENADRISDEDAAKIMEEVNSADRESEGSADESKSRFFLFRWCGGLMKELKMVFNHVVKSGRPDKTGRKTPGDLGQFKLLFKRAALQRVRSPWGTVLNIILMIIAGSIIPSLVPEDANLYVGIPTGINSTNEGQDAYLRQNVSPIDEIPGILLNVYFFLLIVSCLSVNIFGPERVVFFRETAAGQHVTSYWAAKTLETLLWLPVFTCAFVVLGYSSPAWLIQSLAVYWTFLFLTLVGFYGFGMLASILVGAGSAALLALVFGIIVIVGFSGSVNAYGDLNSGGQKFSNFWFLFWATQGLSSEEYSQYEDRFNVTRLNEQTPDKQSSAFGLGEQSVGAGQGMGFDLSSSKARNIGICALTAYAWFIIVLYALKTKDHRRHR